MSISASVTKALRNLIVTGLGIAGVVLALFILARVLSDATRPVPTEENSALFYTQIEKCGGVRIESRTAVYLETDFGVAVFQARSEESNPPKEGLMSVDGLDCPKGTAWRVKSDTGNYFVVTYKEGSESRRAFLHALAHMMDTRLILAE